MLLLTSKSSAGLKENCLKRTSSFIALSCFRRKQLCNIALNLFVQNRILAFDDKSLQDLHFEKWLCWTKDFPRKYMIFVNNIWLMHISVFKVEKASDFSCLPQRNRACVRSYLFYKYIYKIRSFLRKRWLAHSRVYIRVHKYEFSSHLQNNSTTKGDFRCFNRQIT